MKYRIILTEQFRKDLDTIKRSGDKVSVKRVARFLVELAEHPETGTGKPEPLRYKLSGLWSRRVNKFDRLIYRIVDDKLIVEVISSVGHYGDE